jgi:ferredoxin
MIPTINKEECTGCGNCVEVCPPGALIMEDGKARVREDLCEECGFCAPECPLDAIAIPFPLSAHSK